MASDTLLLIDGHALAYRAFFAMPALSNSRGEMTNAAFGFTSMLLKALDEHKPSHAIAAFDPHGPTFRHEKDNSYKAQRPPMPDELRPQLPWCREICQSLGMPLIESQGFEADDVIGTLSLQAEAQGLDVIILTADLDSLQLVDEHCIVYASRRGITDAITYDVAQVMERFGFPPPLVVDYKALRGDASDNIPGVPGIGEKTAISLVQQYGTLEQVLNAVPLMKEGKVKRLLAEHRELAVHSKWMATIRRDVDVALDVEAARLRPDMSRARELFERFEFHTLVSRLPVIQAPGGQTQLAFASVIAEQWAPEVTVIREAAAARAACEALRSAGAVAIHSLLDEDHTMVGIGLAAAASEDGMRAWYLPVGPLGTADPAAQAAVSAALLDTSIAVVGYDLKRELIAWRRRGSDVTALRSDLMLAAYLVNTRTRVPSLATLALELCSLLLASAEGVIGSGRQLRSWRDVAVAEAAAYAGAQAACMAPVEQALRAQLEAASMNSLHDELELPLVPILAAMELAGIGVDTAQLTALSAELEARIEEIEAQVHAIAAEPFNLGSTQKLATFLYDELGLASGRKTKTGRSTDADTLEALREEHPVVPQLLEWRQLTKLKSTYVDALPALCDSSGRVHTSFHQAVAATGRLSSSDPNLQNIPVRTLWGQRIRRAFVADPGHLLISADYSQVELRVLAHLSGEQQLVEAFARGEDIHQRTAATVYGVDAALVTKEMRRNAKVVNFGVLYGLSDFGLARDTGMSREEAAVFIKAYFDRFAAVTAYLERVRNLARESGYAQTAMGRRRHLPDIRAANRQIRSAAERMAVNMPMQGTAADIMKIAMISAARALEDVPGARLLLQVHDELLVEAPLAQRDAVIKELRSAMEGAAQLTVPLDVDVKVGSNWADMTPLVAATAG